MSITITISNTPVSIVEQSPNVHDTIDGRSVATFTVKDLTGLHHYQPGQPVTITDSVSGYTYTGTVNDSDETVLFPNPCIYSAITCVDGHYFADKRYYSGPEFENTAAGDIITNLLRDVLAAEGITAAYASRNDTSITDWSSGTLSNVVGTNNISGGDLELPAAGSAVNVVETGATFSTGSVGNTRVVNGALCQTPFNAIKITGQNTVTNAGNTYSYFEIWNGSHAIGINDRFVYDVFVVASSPEIKVAIDFVCTDGTTWRDTANESNGGNDVQDQPPHPSTDLTGLADGKWYHRDFNINCLNAKSVQYVSVAIEGDKTGTYTAYFRNIYFENSSFTHVQDIFLDATTALPYSKQLQNYGYSGVMVSVATCYDSGDQRWSPSYSLSGAVINASNNTAWTTTTNTANNTDNGSTVQVAYSLDGGVSYIYCVNGGPLPDFPTGYGVSGLSIKFLQALAAGTTPEDTISLNLFEFELMSGYSGTKADITSNVNTNATWSAGTFSNTTNNSGANLSLNGITKNWDDGFSTGQPFVGGPNAEQFVKNKTFLLGVDGIGTTGYDAKSQFTFAPQYQNFTAEIDVLVGGWDAGLLYRTTNFGTGAGTYAFAACVSPTAVYIVRGSNSISTINVVPALKTSTAVTLTPGNWHRLKIVINGTSHQAYLDDVLMVSVTDTNFNSSGYVGAIIRNGNATAPTHRQAQFDNFGIMPALTGSWVSPSISIGAAGTYVNSDVFYANGSTDTVNTTIVTDYTINGGSTWINVPTSIDEFNDVRGTLAFTSGASLAGLSLKYRFTLTTTTASAMPNMNNVQVKIIGGFSGAGSRVSPPLQLLPVGLAGSTLVSWNGVQPANTAIFVDTSLDGTTWTNIGSGASGSGAIAGIQTQADPLVDLFSTDTSMNYSSTFITGGGVASWTWNSTLSRLEASGGTGAVLIYNSHLTAADSDVSVITDTSEAGGLVWRYVNQSNYYELAVHDGSASTNANTIQLFKVVSGTRSQIGSNIAISFTRGTAHTLEANMIGTAINLYFDGVNILTTTDSSIASPGRCGVRNNGGNARFYQLRIQAYGQNVSALEVFGRIRLTSSDPTATPQVSQLIISAHDSSIQNGAIIPITSYSILNGNNVTVAQIFDDCVKQSGNYWWKIKNFKMNFQQHTSQPAPWVVQNGDVQVQNIDVDNINDVYRNSEWVTKGKDIVSLVRSFTGDGVKSTFDLGFTVDSVSSMTLNGVVQNIGVKNADTGKAFYYKQGDTSVTQDTTDIPLNDTQILTVYFNAQVDITVNVQNPTEIARIAAIDNTSGIIEVAIDANVSGKDPLNKAGMITKAYGDLQQYGIPDGKIATFDTIRAGLAVGQLVSLFVSPFGIFDGTFIITDIQLTWKSTAVNGTFVLLPWYTIQATRGPVIGDFTRFINNLAN